MSLPARHQVPLGSIGAPMEKDAPIHRLSEHIFQGPSEGAPPPPRPPPRSLFRERSPIPRAPFILLSKSLADEPSFRFPKRSPYGKRCPSPEPFLHSLQDPQQRSSHSRFPSQSSHRESYYTSRTPFNHISKSPVDESTPGCPTEPQRSPPPTPGSPNRTPIERCPVSRDLLQLSLRVHG